MQSYHMSKSGKMMPCKTTPCPIKSHAGTDIMADSVDEALDKYYEKQNSEGMKNSIINAAVRNAVADPDTSDEAPWLEHKLSTILDGSTVTKGDTDDRNRNLILDSITYASDGVGGSRADYITDHVSDSLAGSDVKLSENFNAKQVFDDITKNAIHPDSELSKYVNRNESSIQDYDNPIPNSWSLLKPETINSVAADKDGNTYRLVPARYGNGDLRIMAVNELGQRICDMSIDRLYTNNRSKSLEAIRRGYGLTKPLKHVDNSIYIDEASVSGLALDRNNGKITGSYMLNTPQGQKRIYRYQFKDDVESVATRNEGYANADDVVKMMKGEDISHKQLPDNWNNLTHDEHVDYWKTKTPSEICEIVESEANAVWDENNIHSNYDTDKIVALEENRLKNSIDGLECNNTRYQNIFNLLEDDNFHTTCTAFENLIKPTN